MTPFRSGRSRLRVSACATLAACCVALAVAPLAAGQDLYPLNYAVVADAAVGEQSGGLRTVTFDLSWPHSWRQTAERPNRDAVWVYVKFRVGGTGPWLHASLSTVTLTYSAAPSSNISPAFEVPADGAGVFIYRAAPGGPGDVALEGVRLPWDAACDELTPGDSVEVRVFALEMVHVPQGAFYVGDTVSVGRFHRGDDPQSPYQVTGGPVVLSTDSDGLWAEATSVTLPGGGAGTVTWDNPSAGSVLPQNYPTGYRAFYVGKYELSQGGYTSFLNTLEPAQASVFYQTTETISLVWTGGSARYTIAPDESNPGYYTCPTPTRVCHWLGWEDQIALADWMGLRPLTELEFEKAARGAGVAPLAGEYCWATTRALSIASFSGVDGSGDETALPANANVLFDRTIFGPCRAGIHEHKEPDRDLSGAGYYGALDMSGSVLESVVTMGTPAGRLFDGSHGDGELDDSGACNQPNWPRALYNAYFVTRPWEKLWPWVPDLPAQAPFGGLPFGYGGKCGDWMNEGEDLGASRLSDRRWATYPTARRLPGYGYRAARSAWDLQELLPAEASRFADSQQWLVESANTAWVVLYDLNAGTVAHSEEFTGLVGVPIARDAGTWFGLFVYDHAASAYTIGAYCYLAGL